MSKERGTFRRCLVDSPRSLATLATEHSDGWGIAVFDELDGWRTARKPVSAAADPAFVSAATQWGGHAVVAHVRRRTVGRNVVENTHPFRSGDWVFAHNGTITEIDYLRSHVSRSRAAAVCGQTDSEWLFAFLLTRLDARAVTSGAEDEVTDATVLRAVEDLTAGRGIGAITFVLSDGASLYAHRGGRSLFRLERSDRRRGTTGLIASEPLTTEAWQEIAENTLLVARRHARRISWVSLGGADEPSSD